MDIEKLDKLNRRFEKEAKAKASRRKVFGYCDDKGVLTDNLLLLEDNDMEVCRQYLRNCVSQMPLKMLLASSALKINVCYLGIFDKEILRFSNEPYPQVLFSVSDVFKDLKKVSEVK